MENEDGKKTKREGGGGRGEIKSFEEDVERWLCYQWSCLRTTENAKATCVSWRVQDAHGYIRHSFPRHGLGNRRGSYCAERTTCELGKAALARAQSLLSRYSLYGDTGFPCSAKLTQMTTRHTETQHIRPAGETKKLLTLGLLMLKLLNDSYPVSFGTYNMRVRVTCSCIMRSHSNWTIPCGKKLLVLTWMTKGCRIQILPNSRVTTWTARVATLPGCAARTRVYSMAERDEVTVSLFKTGIRGVVLKLRVCDTKHH